MKDVVSTPLVNVTLYVQVAFSARVTVPFRQVLTGPVALYGRTAKLAAPVPVMVGALLKASVVVPTFLTVTDSVLLVVTVPKASLAGDRRHPAASSS